MLEPIKTDNSNANLKLNDRVLQPDKLLNQDEKPRIKSIQNYYYGEELLSRFKVKKLADNTWCQLKQKIKWDW